jgi:hypothetical protein
MWRERVAGFTYAYVVAFNKAVPISGVGSCAILTRATLRVTAEEVVGRYGRRHLSPRAVATGGTIRAFSQGFGSGKLRLFYSELTGPPDPPWIVLERVQLVPELWRPLTPVFFPLDFERFTSTQGWSWCSC